METIVKKIAIDNIGQEDLSQAVAFLKAGELVAFPTETVYGLGANALNAKAVEKIFLAKGRPNDNPLIVHIADLRGAEEVTFFSPLAEKLAAAFWPGPLTLVLPKRPRVPDIVCAGLDTVAIRMPRHPLALALIKESGLSLAAPSANTSGRPSPTAANHVFEDLAGKIAMILDGGPVDIGLESTVLDISRGMPQILRPGKITEKDLFPYTGELSHATVDNKKPAAPGMKYAHYAPKGKVILADTLSDIERIYREERPRTDKIFIIATKETASTFPPERNVQIISAKGDLESYARNIFSAFRLADFLGAEIVIVETVAEKELGIAIMNRLRKSAAK